jgi:hypothetical protein
VYVIWLSEICCNRNLEEVTIENNTTEEQVAVEELTVEEQLWT